MQDEFELIEQTTAPTDRPRERLDVTDLPPPKPLTETLDRLADVGDAVLVQVNDRAPQHLYPKIASRGFKYDTVEAGDRVVTAIWRP
jgi:TusA-related sulfurtransferase